MGGKHADDGKGNGEILIQRTGAICRQSRRHTHTHTYLWDSRVPLAVGPGQLFY